MDKLSFRQPILITPKTFEFWRRFSAGAGLGFSYSVGIMGPLSGTTEEEEGEDGDSWHTVSKMKFVTDLS